MRVVKDPSFRTGNHPSEFSECQRRSYCGKAKGVGKSWGSVLTREYPSNVFAYSDQASISYSRVEDRVCIISPFVLDIYRIFFFVSLTKYCTQPKGDYRWYQ